MVQLGNIYLALGKPFESLNIFMDIFRRVQTIGSESEKTERQELFCLATTFDQLGYSQLSMLIFDKLINNKDDDPSKSYSFWMSGNKIGALLDVHRSQLILSSTNPNSNSSTSSSSSSPSNNLNSISNSNSSSDMFWVRYWSQVSQLTILLLQWTRLLYCAYNIQKNTSNTNNSSISNNNGNGNNTNLNGVPKRRGSVDTEHSSIGGGAELDPRDAKTFMGVYGLSEKELLKKGNIRKSSSFGAAAFNLAQSQHNSITGLAQPQKYFDETEGFNEIKQIEDRIPLVKKPVKKMLKDLANFSQIYPFAESTLQVFTLWSELLWSPETASKLATKFWSSYSSKNNCLVPDITLAAFLTIVFFSDNSKLPTNRDSGAPEICDLANSAIQKLLSSNIMPSIVYYKMLKHFESDTELTKIPRNTSAGVGKLFYTLHYKVYSEIKNSVQVLPLGYVDLEGLGEFDMCNFESLQISDTEKKELISEMNKNFCGSGFKQDLLRKVNLTLKAHEYKKWRAEAQSQALDGSVE